MFLSFCFSSWLGQRQWLLSISQEVILWKKSGLWFFFLLSSDRTVQPTSRRPFLWKLCWNRYPCEMFPHDQHFLIKRNILLIIVPGSSPLECLNCFNSSQFSTAASFSWCRLFSCSLFLSSEQHQEQFLSILRGEGLIVPLFHQII